MKRLFLSFSLFSFLLGSTEFGQLLRLRSLLDHYSLHRSTTQDLGFYHFLYLHYVGDDQNPDDDEQEKQLPFKTHFNLLQASVAADPGTPLAHASTGKTLQTFFTGDNRTLSGFLPVILQPPRIS